MKATMAGDAGGDVKVFVANHEKSAITKASIAAHSAIDKAAVKSKPAINRVAKMAHDATDKAASAGSKTVDWVVGQNEGLSAAHKKLLESTKTCVSANPLKAMAMGLLAGFVIHRVF